MIKKAMVLLLFAMILGVNAQNRLEDILKFENVKGTLGSYWEHVDFQRNNRDDRDFGTAYLQVLLETKGVAGFNLGAEFLGHMELWSHGQTIGGVDAYDNDIEPDAKQSLSMIYLKYTNDVITAKLGRIDDMKVTHLDDNRYEGAIVKAKIGDQVVLSGGAIRGVCELDYDDAEDFDGPGGTYLDRLGPQVDELLFFAEARVKVCKGFSANPYVYYHGDYASVYGLDTDTSFALGDKKSVGLLAQGYYVNSEFNSDDAECWHLSLYAKLGGLTLRAGESQMDGSGTTDTDMVKPYWFRDYMVFNDQTQLSHAIGARAYYAMGRFAMDKWWVSLYVGKYDALAGHHDDVELQVGYQITKALDVNLRLINMESDIPGQDLIRHEGRIQYKF